MHVLRADGRSGVITGWKIVPGVKVMYNLEVAQDHTFTVGSGEWVVHNCDISGLVNQEARDQVTKLQHAFSEQLDEETLGGASKDSKGLISGFWEEQQRSIDHLTKVQQALNGAERRVGILQNLLNKEVLSETDRCIVQCVINQAKSFIDYAYNTVLSDEWDPGVPPSFP